MVDLRRQFFNQMCELAEKDKDVILLTGDLGYSFCEEYTQKFPKQFINCGCIEQSMVGIAAGMALGGKKPYVYSGTIFLLMRAYEQVRDDVAYNNLNVKLIGTGASQFLGFTHNLQGNENEQDLLKNLPNIKISYPQNEEELRSALLSFGPAFIRI
jgi:transketolase